MRALRVIPMETKVDGLPPAVSDSNYNKQNRTKRKSINKNRTKRNSKRVSRSKKREYTGGGNIITILDVLLSKDVINILPTSQIFDYKKVDRYLNMIDVDNLKYQENNTDKIFAQRINLELNYSLKYITNIN